jgi:hypothetical protein
VQFVHRSPSDIIGNKESERAEVGRFIIIMANNARRATSLTDRQSCVDWVDLYLSSQSVSRHLTIHHDPRRPIVHTILVAAAHAAHRSSLSSLLPYWKAACLPSLSSSLFKDREIGL